MKVLIAGAGIGGLSAAIALKKEGHEVHCYDRVREMRPIGAAISVWSNGVKALQSFGLDPMKYAGQMDRMSYRKHDTGETLCDFPLDTLYTKVKSRACPIARSDLQKILYEGTGSESVTLNKQVADYEATDHGVTVKFSDGSSVSGDFLIIADGTHSILRNKICAQPIERNYVGYINFNAAIPQSVVNGKLPATTWTQFVGEGKRVSFMPMSNDRFYVFFDCVLPKGTAVDPQGVKTELKSYFQGWNEAVQLLIDNVDITSIARVEIHDTDTLPTLIDPSGRAVLIGDAAHATAPDLGQGGCLAMEDAFVIANLTKKHGLPSSQTGRTLLPTKDQLVQLCTEYQEQRGKRVGDTVLRARKRAAVTHALESMQQTEEWYRELSKEDGSRIIEGMSKTILGAPKELDRYTSLQPVRSNQSDHLRIKVADSA